MNSMIKSSIFMALAAFAGSQAASPVTYESVKATKEVNGKTVEYEKKVAIIDGESTESLDIPEDVVVDSVFFKRSVKAGVTSTIMLPFEIDTWRVKNTEVYTYAKVTKAWDGNEWSRAPWIVYISHVYPQVMKANTPYLFIPSKNADGLYFDISNDRPTVTLNTTTNSRQVEYSDKYGSWNFIGTYDFKQWNEGDSDLGRVFGFAANDINDIKAGEFVKGKAGIKIRPMRAYIKCLKTGSAAAKMASYASIDDEVLPDTLEVRILEDDSTTSVHFGTMNMRTGEMLKDNWVDLNGRKLYRKPTTKGIYYNNGIKVIIK